MDHNKFYKFSYKDIGLSQEDRKAISGHVRYDSIHDYNTVRKVLDKSVKTNLRIEELIYAISNHANYESCLVLFDLQYSRSSFYDSLHIAYALLAIHYHIITKKSTIDYIMCRLGTYRSYRNIAYTRYKDSNIDKASATILQYTMLSIGMIDVKQILDLVIIDMIDGNVFRTEAESKAVKHSILYGMSLQQAIEIASKALNQPIVSTPATLSKKRRIALCMFIDRAKRYDPDILQDKK